MKRNREGVQPSRTRKVGVCHRKATQTETVHFTDGMELKLEKFDFERRVNCPLRAARIGFDSPRLQDSPQTS